VKKGGNCKKNCPKNIGKKPFQQKKIRSQKKIEGKTWVGKKLGKFIEKKIYIISAQTLSPGKG